MAGKIFINYRRDADWGVAQALYQRLEDEFAPGDLFMDVEGHIKPGDDFVEVLIAKVAAADVLLVVIGPRWAELLGARQGDRDDFVAIEIKAALDQGKRVIPVLVGGAGMPRTDTLPEAIRPLARRNAVGLRPERFRGDCQGLVLALRETLAAAEQERAARTEAERKASEAARLEAEAQATARVMAAEERGRAQAAAGLSAEDVRKAEELASWNFVKDRNDLQDLRDHLARFPGGPTERWARTKLDRLVWAGLGSTPAMEYLRAYLDEFPKGANAGAAQARIDALEREAAEARAVEQERAEWGAVEASNDLNAIEAFLKRWPNGQHAKEAQARAFAVLAAEAKAAEQERQETAEWGAVANSNNKLAIEAFLERWPTGQHANAARARIAVLESEAAEARAAEQQRAQETAEWGAVAASTDIESIQAFLERRPDGQHANAARARIAVLESEAAEARAAEQQRAQETAEWGAVAASTDIESIQAFLERRPDGQHANAARARIAVLESEAVEARAAEQRAKETRQWRAAAASTDKGAIEAFLKQWPNGQHAEAARARIAESRRGIGGLRRGILLGAVVIVAVVLLWVAARQSGVPPWLSSQPTKPASTENSDAAGKAQADAEAAQRKKAQEAVAEKAAAEKAAAEKAAAEKAAEKAAAEKAAAEKAAAEKAAAEKAAAEKAAAEKAAAEKAAAEKAAADKRRAEEDAARRDPAISVQPGSGQSFRDRLANGQPCPTCPEMVVVPNGKFTMGSPDSEPGHDSDEVQVSVSIAKPFAVGKFAVTGGEFAAFVEETGHKTDGGCYTWSGSEWTLQADKSWRAPGFAQDDRNPVVCVNWNDAKAYAEWLSSKTGKTYRLLSEAEREYVTRAGTTTPFWWGTSITPLQANYNGNFLYAGGGSKGQYRKRTVPVDSFKPNPWGLFNVHGNAWEWTEDCWNWNASNSGNPGNGSARTTGDCRYRVVRGGSWLHLPQNLRSASRSRLTTDLRDSSIGFRLGRTLTP